VRFPFSDLSATKLRPAVVLASAGQGDWVLCQITSNAYGDHAAIVINEGDFVSGCLQRVSYARPGKLFTANASLMKLEAGHLTAEALSRLIEAVVRILKKGCKTYPA
jgi:mRNA interferase MazF